MLLTPWNLFLHLPAVVLCAKVQKGIPATTKLGGVTVTPTKSGKNVITASTSKPTAKTVCTTSACKKTAGSACVLYMFSKFSGKVSKPDKQLSGSMCRFLRIRKWISTNEIPADETEISELSLLPKKIKKVLPDILKAKGGRMFASEVKAKGLFGQCSNDAELEKLRGRPLQGLLNEYLGGWPVLQSKWNPSQFDLFDRLVKNFRVDIQPFFTVSVGEDVENNLINRIYIDASSTYAAVDTLNDAIAGKLFTDSYLTLVFNATSMLLKDLRSAVNVNSLSANLTAIVEMERSFGMARLTAAKNIESKYLNRMTLAAFQDHYKFNSTTMRNMTSIIRAYFAAANLSSIINDNTTIGVITPRFWPVLDAKLSEFESLGDEGKRRLANYMGWKFVATMLSYLSTDYRHVLAEYYQRVTGAPTVSVLPVGERCLEVVTKILPLSLGAMYVRDLVPRDLKKKATMMVSDIQDGFRELLKSASWMDKTTQQRALNKLKSVINVVAYPDIYMTNTTAIDEEYKLVTIEKTYLETFIKSSTNTAIQQLKKLPKTNLRYDPVSDILDITAALAYPNRNFISMMAGILQLPFYDSESLQYLNYGGIGFMIAHETTHNFDSAGANYDEQGLRRVWWSNKTAAQYEARMKGMMQQYDKSGKVNGQLTLGENIADNGGLRAAYNGYTKYLQRISKPEPVLPGLEKYTPIQLFFLSSGQVWCNKQRIETERLYLLQDNHAPNRFRVNGVVSNMPEFSTAFKCRKNAPMNPAVKQVVW